MPKWFCGPNVFSDKVMTPTEAAYVAGFTDGEGTVGIVKAKRKENRCGFRFQPYLSLANTNMTVMETIQRMCGNGRIVQNTHPSMPHHKPVYALRFSPHQIRHVLPQLQPYLVIKRRQADYLMEFLDNNANGRNKPDALLAKEHQIRDVMRGLNARGVQSVQ